MSLLLPPPTGNQELDYFLAQLSSNTGHTSFAPSPSPGLPGGGGSSENETAGPGGVPALGAVAYNQDHELTALDCRIPTDRNRAPGLSLNAASVGAKLNVLWFGFRTYSSWSWTPGRPIYLGENGALTQLRHKAPAYTQILGVALAPTAIYFAPQTPDSSIRERRFDFGDASPLPIGIIPAGQVVKKILIWIETAFTDPAATLTVGPTGSPADLVDIDDLLPATAGLYEVSPARPYASNTPLYLTLSPGSSSAGTGYITLLLNPFED